MTASLTGKPDAVKLLLAARRERQRRGAVQRPDGADVGGQRRQRGRGRSARSRTARTSRRSRRAASRRFCSPSATIIPMRRSVLLEHGANVNDAAPDGTSALNMAVVNAYFELAAMLARSRRQSECAGSARLGAAYARVAAKAGSRRRRRRRQHRHAPPLPTRHDDGARAREDAARTRRQPERPRRAGRRTRSARKAARRGTRRTSSSAGIS